MKRQRIYVDTSVIGGCFDQEFAVWSEGLFRDFQEGNFKPVTSDVTAAEIEAAPEFVQEKYAELLTLSPDILMAIGYGLDFYSPKWVKHTRLVNT